MTDIQNRQNVDMHQYEIKQPLGHRLDAAPSDPAPINSQYYFDTVTRSWNFWDEVISAWVPFPGFNAIESRHFSSINGGANQSGKNYVINGSFNVWQRGTSFAAVADQAYTADRFAHRKVATTGVSTISRSTDVPTFANAGALATYSLKVDCTTADAAVAAGDYTLIGHRVEGFYLRFMASRAMTLSFWVKATKVGIYCVSFRNSAEDRSYVAEYTVNTTATWEKKTITLTMHDTLSGTWNFTNGTGLRVTWTLMAGATFQAAAGSWQTGNFHATANQVNGLDNVANDFCLTLIQLENGLAATPFEPEPIEQTIDRCHRYYFKTFNIDTAPVQNAGNATCSNGQSQGINSNQTCTQMLPFPERMRAAPTATFFSPGNASAQVWNATTAVACTLTTVVTATDTCLSYSFTTAGGSSQGDLNIVHITLDAELT